MLFRAQVRSTALQLLQSAITQTGAQVSTSKDTPVQTGKTPSIVVYTDDVKTGQGGAPPQFRTDVLTTIEVVAEGTTKAAAESLCDGLCDTIENTLLNGASAFVALFEQIDRVESRPDYRGVESKVHTFTVVIEITAHVTELFEPTPTCDLKGVNIYVDSVNAFDASGTYQPPFAYPVSAAPRTTGPDGRVEIGGSADFGPAIVTEDGVVLTDENGNVIIAPDTTPDNTTGLVTEDGIQLVDEYGNRIIAPNTAPNPPNPPNLTNEAGQDLVDESGDDIVAP